MPRPPSPDDGEHQETVEISSDEEDQEDDESSPMVRESQNDQGAGDTETGDPDVDMDEVNADEEGQPSEAKKRRIGVRSIIEHFDKMIEDANQRNFCFQCGGEHALEVCPEMNDNMMANALNKMRSVMEEQSKSPSSDRSRTSKVTRRRKDKLPKKSVIGLDSLNRRKCRRASTTNLPTCSRLGTERKVEPCWSMVLKSTRKGRVCRIKISLVC